MTPIDFARLWHSEKSQLIEHFLDAGSGGAVATAINALDLSPPQASGLHRVLDLALTDTMYTLLLGIDGSAAIGGRQETYRLFAEGGAQLSGTGELEGAAWEVFHGPGPAEPDAERPGHDSTRS